jgi:fructosamine-3-kinase
LSALSVERLTGRVVHSVTPAGGRYCQVEFADGSLAFAKTGSPGFAAEANGLRWLAAADAVPVPEVLAVDDDLLVISFIPTSAPSAAAARRLGTELAVMHRAGAASFGADWPGYIASLPLSNTAGSEWPAWYATHRLAPFLRTAFDSGALSAADVSVVEAVMARIDVPAEPVSRIHGDLWSGNVLWSGDRAWLIDPAAHGGHRETDLAMLALFGVPYLDSIIAGYQEVAPLAEGWQRRVALHQLHPLLVHACLFGGSYREAVGSAARTALAG